MLMNVRRVCVYLELTTELMLSTHVALQMSKLTKSFYRTRGIRTVSPSCEYACAVSNHQMYEKLYRTHHIHTVSRSCAYACVWPI